MHSLDGKCAGDFLGIRRVVPRGDADRLQRAVGSSYNFAAPIYHRVLDALSSGNTHEAAQWQARAAKSIEVITSFGYLPAAKKIMQWIGVDCGPAAAAGQPLRSKTGLGRFFEWIDECKTA